MNPEAKKLSILFLLGELARLHIAAARAKKHNGNTLAQKDRLSLSSIKFLSIWSRAIREHDGDLLLSGGKDWISGPSSAETKKKPPSNASSNASGVKYLVNCDDMDNKKEVYDSTPAATQDDIEKKVSITRFLVR